VSDVIGDTAGSAGSDGYQKAGSHYEKTRETNFQVDGVTYWVLRSEHSPYLYSRYGLKKLDSDKAAYLPIASDALLASLQTQEIPSANEVFNVITDFAKDYLDFEDSRVYAYYACWIVHCYVFNIQRVTPYVVYSGRPDTGKTSALNVSCCLSPSGNTVSVSPSSAAVTRITHWLKQPLFVDEYDKLPDAIRGELVSTLNNGYVYGGCVIRCNQNDYNDIERLEIFCPKAFTVNDISAFTDTTRDRITEIVMYKAKNKKKKIEDLSLDSIRIDSIRSLIYRFLAGNDACIDRDVDGVGDTRYEQLSTPILKIATMLGCEDDVRSFLSDNLKEKQDEQEDNLEIQFLRLLLQDIESKKEGTYRMRDLREFCPGAYPSDESIGRLMKRLGLHHFKKRNNGVVYWLTQKQVETVVHMTCPYLVPVASPEPSVPAVPAVVEG